MSGAIWTGFRSRPWDPEALRLEREAWETEYLPRLREIAAERERVREQGRRALASLPDDVRAEIVAAYGRSP